MLDDAFIFKAIVQMKDKTTVNLFFTDAYPAGKEWDIEGFLTGVSLDDCMEWLRENKHLSADSCSVLKLAILSDLKEALAKEEEDNT